MVKTTLKVGDRVKLNRTTPNEAISLWGFKFGMIGQVMRVDYPYVGHTEIKWENGVTITCRNEVFVIV